MPLRYLVEPAVSDFPYHIDIIKEKLSRTLPAILPDVIEELKVAVPEHIPTKGDGERNLRRCVFVSLTSRRLDFGECHVDAAEGSSPCQQPCFCWSPTLCVLTPNFKLERRLTIICGLTGRNEEFLEMAIRFTIDIMKDQVIISMIPTSLTK